jgi:hypothetical protein
MTPLCFACGSDEGLSLSLPSASVDFVAIKPYLIGWTVAEPFLPVCVSMGSNGCIAFELVYFHILLVSIVNRKDGEPYTFFTFTTFQPFHIMLYPSTKRSRSLSL